MSVKRKGIALALTMLILGVMTIISVAFFQAYSSHFSITRASRSSEIAASGCEAVFDYVSYRLEYDRNWGETDFAEADLDKDQASPYLNVTSISGSHRFEGTIPDSGAKFQGTIYNSLNVPEGGAIAGPLFPPRGTARCEVECRSGDAVRRVEFMLRVAPIFESSVLSKADLRVNAETLTMRSKDRNRNMLRSEQDIYVPNMLDGSGQTKFYQYDGSNPNTTDADHNGLLWAKGDIYSYLTPGDSTAEMVDEADELSAAQSTSNGRLASKASSHYSVFDMRQEQMLENIPDTHTEIPLNNPFTGTPMAGRFTFTRRTADVTFNATYDVPADDERETISFTGEGIYIDVLEYYANPEDTVPTAVFRAQERTDDLISIVPSQIVEDDGWGDWEDPGYLDAGSIETTGVNIDIPGYTGGVQILENNKLVFGSEDGANMTFNLEAQEVTSTHDAYIKVAGEFHVTSESPLVGGDESPGSEDPRVVPPPVLKLGFEADDAVNGGVSKSVIRSTGSIDISNGVTEGLGSLIADSNVTIKPKNTSTVNVEGLKGAGLTIYAGRDVQLTSPESVDDWKLKGVVFARGGIRMNGADGGIPSATFEGSLVAMGEDFGDGNFQGIEFTDCEDIEFVYDNEMLTAYVAKLPGERIQVETVYWRD